MPPNMKMPIIKVILIYKARLCVCLCVRLFPVDPKKWYFRSFLGLKALFARTEKLVCNILTQTGESVTLVSSTAQLVIRRWRLNKSQTISDQLWSALNRIDNHWLDSILLLPLTHHVWMSWWSGDIFNQLFLQHVSIYFKMSNIFQ